MGRPKEIKTAFRFTEMLKVLLFRLVIHLMTALVSARKSTSFFAVNSTPCILQSSAFKSAKKKKKFLVCQKIVGKW